MKLYSLAGLLAGCLVTLLGRAETVNHGPGWTESENSSHALSLTDTRYLRHLTRLVQRTANKGLNHRVPHRFARISDLARQVVQDIMGPSRTRAQPNQDCIFPETRDQILNEPEEFMHGRLAVWQERFRMDHWKIGISLVRRRQLAPGTVGDVTWSGHSATIRALDPADYDLEPCRIVADLEETIVHELIHLFFAESVTEAGSLQAEEHRVHLITKALLELSLQPASRQDARPELMRASNRAGPRH